MYYCISYFHNYILEKNPQKNITCVIFESIVYRVINSKILLRRMDAVPLIVYFTSLAVDDSS